MIPRVSETRGCFLLLLFFRTWLDVLWFCHSHHWFAQLEVSPPQNATLTWVSFFVIKTHSYDWKTRTRVCFGSLVEIHSTTRRVQSTHLARSYDCTSLLGQRTLERNETSLRVYSAGIQCFIFGINLWNRIFGINVYWWHEWDTQWIISQSWWRIEQWEWQWHSKDHP